MRKATLLLALALLAALPARAQIAFTDATAGDLLTPVPSWGASWVDYDGDGDLDLFASRIGTTGGNVLYRNDGGVFTAADVGPLTDSASRGSLGHTWADYDNDGDPDVYVAGGLSRLYRNDGGTFSLVEGGDLDPDGDIRGWAAAWGDYDGDGLLDLVVVHPAGFVGTPSQENHLFHNEGGGAFARVTGTPITEGLAPYTVGTWSDHDLDGDLDLFVGAGPVSSPGPDYLYENEGGGAFGRITTAPIATDLRDGQVMNWVDYDNDGDLDLYVTNYSAVPTNDLYRNDGGGTYTTITTGPLATDASALSLANTWGDLDHDGDLDAFVTTGGAVDRLYENEGGGVFTRVMGQPPVASSTPTAGATLGDYDGDGDLDLAVTSQTTLHPVRLYRNDLANGNASFLLELVGVVSNRAGIGAKVWATATIFGELVTQLREVSAQNTFNGHNALTVHFGLGDAATIEELRIEWPSGPEDVYTDVAVADFGGRATAVEGEGLNPVAAEPGAAPARTALDAPAPNPAAGPTLLRYNLAASSAVTLAVYDVLGREVAVLATGVRPAGAHAVRFDPRALPAGVYVARLRHAGGVEARPLTVAR
jgi:hypothetical protein